MTSTEHPVMHEPLATAGSPAPPDPANSAQTQQSASDTEWDVLGESRTDPASLLRPNPTFPGDEVD